MAVIRPCRDAERAEILAIVNAAAEAYRDVIPDDRWHEPYMTRSALDGEIDGGAVEDLLDHSRPPGRDVGGAREAAPRGAGRRSPVDGLDSVDGRVVRVARRDQSGRAVVGTPGHGVGRAGDRVAGGEAAARAD